MTVSELIERLLQEDPEAVVLSAGPDSGGYDVELGSPGVETTREGHIMVWYCADKDVKRPIKTEWVWKSQHGTKAESSRAQDREHLGE